VAEEVELHLLNRGNNATDVLVDGVDAEREDKPRVLRVDLGQAVVAALVDVDDVVALRRARLAEPGIRPR
jgi:hypothetical protein